MSVSTDLTVEFLLPDGRPGGEFVTYDADLMFSSLRLDAEGRLWVIADRHDPSGATEPRPFDWTGTLCFQETSGEDRVSYSALVANGRIVAIRPGWREAWAPAAVPPEAAPNLPLAVFARLHGQPTQAATAHDHAGWVMLNARGDGLAPAPDGLHWVVAPSGVLVQLPVATLDAADAWRTACMTEPQPVHGWLFLTDPAGVLPPQAMRFVAGNRQWVVPVGPDGVARAPAALAETGPEPHPDDARNAALRAACRVLPTDYTDYGGEVVRWGQPDEPYGDCSSGCRWWHPLHNAAKGMADADWGVCAKPDAPRCGLLTWEHQAGHRCFEAPPRVDRAVRGNAVVHRLPEN